MKQLLQSEFNKGGKIYKNISSPETSGTQTQVTNINLNNNLLKLSTDNGATFIDVATQQGNSNKSEIDGLLSQTSTMLSDIENLASQTSTMLSDMENLANNIQNLANNNINIKNANSGFSAGNKATTTGGGGAVGNSANAEYGGAIGFIATAKNGGAIGWHAKATGGGAVGELAKANNGGAVGEGAVAGDGFSGGHNAQAGKDSNGNYIDAIQLGEGTNNTPKTLQVYNYKVYDFNKDSLYCRRLNDKTPAVIETVWSGTLKNDGSTTITVNTYRQYDYFILYGNVGGQFCNIISNTNGTYGFTKKSETSSSIMVYSFGYTNGSFTWGESGYYESGNFTFVDRTGTSFYNLYKIEGVKICKA